MVERLGNLLSQALFFECGILFKMKCQLLVDE